MLGHCLLHSTVCSGGSNCRACLGSSVGNMYLTSCRYSKQGMLNSWARGFSINMLGPQLDMSRKGSSNTGRKCKTRGFFSFTERFEREEVQRDVVSLHATAVMGNALTPWP